MHNTIIAIGHLTADPELRHTSSGKAICSFRFCCSDSAQKNKCFISVETWEKTAEACATYLKKGREVLVKGEVCLSSWEKDGKTVSQHYIKASEVKFLGGNKKEGSSSNSKPAESQKSSSSQPDEDDDIPF